MKYKGPFFRLRASDGSQCLMARGWADPDDTDPKKMISICITATSGKPVRDLRTRMEIAVMRLNRTYERRWED